MSDEHEAADARAERVALSVVVACLVYGGSLALQIRMPAVRTMLALDLGPGVRPTYYLRVGVSLLAGLLAAGIARLAARRTALASGTVVAWATAVLVGLAVLLAVLFP